MEKDLQLPIENLEGVLLLPGRLNGQTGRWVLDTGSCHSLANQALCPAADSPAKEASVYNGGLQKTRLFSGAADVEIGPLQLPGHPMALLDLTYVEKELHILRPEMVLLGTLGMDILRRRVLRLDYAANRAVLNPSDPFPTREEIPLKLAGNAPTVSASIAGREGRFLVDTGATACLADRSFADKSWPLLEKQRQIYQLPELILGSRVYQNLPVVLDDTAAIEALPLDGVLGYPILSAQLVELDFPRRRMRLGPKYSDES